MGLGQLKDAALRERRRRLLGADMVAAVRRPSRAQLGALVDGERQTHSHLAAVSVCLLLASIYMCSTVVEGKTSCFNHGDFFCLLLFQTVASEEKRGFETLMMGRPTNPLHSSPTVAGKFTMQARASSATC